MLPDPPKGPPWHLWIVGVFFVLLNGAGAYDHIMTLGQDAGRRGCATLATLVASLRVRESQLCLR